MSQLDLAQRRALLARSWLLQQLTPEQLDELATRSVTQRYPANGTIFERGDPGNSVMAVVTGRVNITVTSAEGRELVLNVMRPLDVFGEIAVLDGKERTASATALVATELLIVRARDLLPLIKQNPDVSFRLIELLCGRLRATSRQVEEMQFHGLETRLARCVLQLAASDGVATPRGRRINVKLSQSEIARLVGASRENVNRQLAEWQREGWISRDGRFLVLHAEEELASLAEAE
ncbi:MAG TPA: Crp/Fnr family transcriptional regulator [Stellaceae bacterium]|nr:Crp/Fnr family transcriptional regulator [Stellaceae bacterium]